MEPHDFIELLRSKIEQCKYETVVRSWECKGFLLVKTDKMFPRQPTVSEYNNAKSFPQRQKEKL